MRLRTPRGGRWVETFIPTKRHRRTKENDPIGADRIIGVDSESLWAGDSLKTVLVPYSSAFGDVVQPKPIDDPNPIRLVLDFTFEHFAEPYEWESMIVPRVGKGMRDNITPVVWVFYNLEYDIQRLFSPESPFFRVLRQSHGDMVIDLPPYKLQFASINPTGSAPSFHLIAWRPDIQRVARIYALDMWGYWKSGLDKTAKSLGVGEKLADVPKEWFQIPLEEWTADMWDTFRKYAGTDSRLTRGVYLATAELLGSISKTVFTRTGILPPSAPAAAARMAFGLASANEWRRAPKVWEQMALDGYHGGYVAMLERGAVEGVTVADLHSAYPSAMLLLPDPCSAEYVRIPPGVWTEVPPGIRARGGLGFVIASFRIKDGIRFPSVSETFRKYTGHQTGVYDRFVISIPELSVMLDLKQADEAAIHDGFMVIGDVGSSFLRQFVQKMYRIKQEEEENDRKNSPLYLASKLLMNSLYGKLIQINEPDIPAVENSVDLDEQVTLPPGGKMHERKQMMAQIYVTGGMEALFAASRENYVQCVKMGVTPERVTVHQLLANDTATAGAYFMPIYASLITAMTRAKICALMNCFQAIGGDTDSFFTRLAPNTPEWERAEAWANEIAIRAGVGGVRNHGGLLGYGVEMVGGRGWIAGIKQYALSADGHKPKLAHHAITDPPGDTKEEREAFCVEAIRQLASGEKVTYTTRTKPRRLRESLLKNDGKFGIFVERERTITPKMDERLEMVRVDPNGNIHYKWKDRKHLLKNE